MGSILYLHPEAHKEQFKMLLQIHLVVSLLVVAMGGPGTRPPLRPQPRQEVPCGNFPTFMTGDRIVGGVAAADPIPWQVAIRQGNWQFCGGSILDETTIMCAAHCFEKDQSMSGYNVRAGVKDKNDNSGRTIEIANGVWNDDMPYEGNNNDFIILKLKNALTFNDDVGPICIPEPDHAPDATGQTCFVSGWGTLESGGSSTSALQWVAVPTVTNQQCSQAYSGITDSMICAGFPEGGKDSCQGDSGGPFVCEDNGKAVLTGVVSFGIGCALPNTPGVYARVTAVLDWVKANMGGTPSPTTAAPPPKAECPNNYIADSYCDDECNYPEYDYDGGDCCGDDVNEQYCEDCDCLEVTETTQAPDGSNCQIPHWFGDNYCDDENNNSECGYDGGDCCGDNVNTTYCSECLCLEYLIETTQAPDGSNCQIPHWFGDNYCDDENNNSECGYDGGDCCGDNVNT